MKTLLHILFLGETYRADAQTWIKGIEEVSGLQLDTAEIKPSTSRWKRITNAIGFFFWLIWKYHTGKQYDLVLAERSTSYGFLSLFTNAKVKVIAQQGISDIYPPTPLSKFYKSILQRIVYKRADLIHAWGNAMVPAMLKSGANPEKILVMPKGLDLLRYQFQEHDYSGIKEWRAIVTRTLEDDYCHKDIIQAIAILKTRGVILKTTIIGRGSLSKRLKQMSKELGIEAEVDFTGPIPNDQLPKLLKASQIYISAPKTEGVSSSLIEAMACGCFPIVTDLPGNRAFINPHRNGKIVPVHQPTAIADAVMSFIQNSTQYLKGIKENRNLVEADCDRKKNMKVFWQKYCSL